MKLSISIVSISILFLTTPFFALANTNYDRLHMVEQLLIQTRLLEQELNQIETASLVITPMTIEPVPVSILPSISLPQTDIIEGTIQNKNEPQMQSLDEILNSFKIQLEEISLAVQNLFR